MPTKLFCQHCSEVGRSLPLQNDIAYLVKIKISDHALIIKICEQCKGELERFDKTIPNEENRRIRSIRPLIDNEFHENKINEII